MKRIMLFAAVAGLLACTPQPKDEITASGLKRSDFQAEVDGKKTDLYRLANASGMEVCVTNYGGRVVSAKAVRCTMSYSVSTALPIT